MQALIEKAVRLVYCGYTQLEDGYDSRFHRTNIVEELQYGIRLEAPGRLGACLSRSSRSKCSIHGKHDDGV